MSECEIVESLEEDFEEETSLIIYKYENSEISLSDFLSEYIEIERKYKDQLLSSKLTQKLETEEIMTGKEAAKVKNAFLEKFRNFTYENLSDEVSKSYLQKLWDLEDVRDIWGKEGF